MGEVKGIGAACNASPFSYRDDVSSVSSKWVYYRVRAVTVAGNYKSTKYISITRNRVSGITVSPNPASEYAYITYSATAEEVIEVNIFDMLSKRVLNQHQKVFRGSNTFAIQSLNRLTPGVYTVNLNTANGMIRKKLVIDR